MSWFKGDDRLHSSPKWAPLSFAARGLWAHANSWVADRLTDGRVPANMLRAWGAPTELAQELVDARLWDAVPDGFQFHNWLKYNRSRETVLAERADNARRQAEFRSRGKSQPRNGVTNALVRPESGSSALAPVPVPVPVPEEKETTKYHARDQSMASVGHDLMFNATGRYFGLDEWRTQLERIGLKPAAERVAVERSLLACEFRRANPNAVTPGYALKHWDRYAAGNPPLKTVVRAVTAARYAGPSEVLSPEEYAVPEGGVKW